MNATHWFIGNDKIMLFVQNVSTQQIIIIVKVKILVEYIPIHQHH